MAKRQTSSNARIAKAPRAQRQGPSAASRIADRIQVGVGIAYRGQSREFYMLLGVVAALVGFGLIMVLSASYVTQLAQGNPWFSIILKQTIFVVAGFGAMTLAILVKPTFLERWFPFAYGIMLLVQLSVFVLGKEVNGNRNWIQIAGFSFQPSEFFKVILPLALAYALARNQGELDNRRTWIQASLVLLPPIAIIMAQKDLGTVIVIVAQFMGLAILAGIPGRLLRTIALWSIPIMGILLSLSSSRIPRIMAWLFPSDATEETFNWQQNHGLWALAAGGFTGVGLGAGKMKWSWIPAVDNDFIFAVIGEELGMVGCALVITLFAVLLFALIRIAQKTENPFQRYFVLGVATWISAQAFINIAVVLRLAPVLGVPLPLISQGGTSMVAVLGALGIVLGIERQNHLGGSSQYAGVVRPMRARREPAKQQPLSSLPPRRSKP